MIVQEEEQVRGILINLLLLVEVEIFLRLMYRNSEAT